MGRRVIALVCALSVLGACGEKTPAERAQEVREAEGQVAEEQKDASQAAERLEKASDQYREEEDELKRARSDLREAREELTEQLRHDSTVQRPQPPRS
jgi:hypothetical protein